MTARSRSIVGALALALLSSAALALPVEREHSDDILVGVDRVSQVILDGRKHQAGPMAIAVALGGPRAIEDLRSLFDVIARGHIQVRIEGRGIMARDVGGHEEAAIFQVLRTLPWDAVRAHLTERVAERPWPVIRTAALRIAGEVAPPTDLALLAEFSAPDPGERVVDRALRAHFVSAFGRAIDREPASLEATDELFEAVHPSHLAGIVQALRERPSPASLEALADVLGIVEEADPMLLRAVDSTARELRQPFASRVRGAVRKYIEWDSPSLAQAVVTVGNLGDAESAGRLVELLGHSNAPVRDHALRSLRQLSGESLGPIPDDWIAWYRRTRSWKANDAAGELHVAATGSKEHASRALLSIAEHRLYRHEHTTAVARALQHGDRDVVITACAVLGHLGSPLAADPLLQRLADGDDEVRRAAYLALRRLTGEDHGEDPGSWQEAGW